MMRTLAIVKVIVMAAAAVVWFVLAANDAGTGWSMADVAIGSVLALWAIGDGRKAFQASKPKPRRPARPVPPPLRPPGPPLPPIPPLANRPPVPPVPPPTVRRRDHD
jgi:hypothetical protein